MSQIKDSVRSGFAVAKQAAQRYAEKMSFSDRLQISGLTNSTPIGSNDVSTRQPANKKYVIVDVLSKKQLMIASKEWIVGKDLCAFPNDMVDIHLQKCDQPNENWSLMKCKVTHELGALTHRFLSSSVNEKDLGKLYDIATQGYFHDMRDKMMKRSRRKQDQKSEENMLNEPNHNRKPDVVLIDADCSNDPLLCNGILNKFHENISKESNPDVISYITYPHRAFDPCEKVVQCEARVLNDLDFDYNSDDFISTAVYPYHEVNSNVYSC
ncbi:unnamed protein product [Schistosoma margrebowiei]|uniref:Uncharacterized protein n=1 Tax=Schistosoma margrebowiei TaxID=48269 RepID=A0A183LGD8_9TREM|nr:unnamed protein product [Schistosoma margrebowiei]